MSMDTVDDLHEAEDMAGALAATLTEIGDRITEFSTLCEAEQYTDTGAAWELFNALHTAARKAAESWANYCRPTCGADGSREAGEEFCGSDCGCPCGHADEEG